MDEAWYDTVISEFKAGDVQVMAPSSQNSSTQGEYQQKPTAKTGKAAERLVERELVN